MLLILSTCDCRTMSRSYEYPTKRQNGSDYYSHVQRIVRAPSVLTEVPHYGQTLFNNQASVREDYGGYQQKQRIPEAHNSVEVTERVTQSDKNGNRVVFEETIDVQADGFIEGNHKGFELCKWKTFKGR
ncbi:PREDICTED: phloem specific [Prunus dulcis]|uniref:PREDICTED: phloem specific n=1 Tax=Prunus dulcis TaxID=3755 RepID=A0A5E4FGZ0_PRUDU|nr:hypothetical protein L3X38_029122 [Prunus dulcis]VVA25891.1 PREDICTED: phloem specific [Prunus dulcis]